MRSIVVRAGPPFQLRIVTSNPFSTRFIRPGAVEFLFPAGQTAETLVETLRQHAWQGQIIGPHGSGKSTLLAALVPALEAAGRKCVAARVQAFERMRDGETEGRREGATGGDGDSGVPGTQYSAPGTSPATTSDSPIAANALPLSTHGTRQLLLPPVESLDENTQLIIDGFEQLSWWSRRSVKQVCRSRGAGLLVTAHQDLGLPTLLRTEPSLELAQAVVARLLPPGDETLRPEDISRAFEATGGNLRETLFGLYDVYQQRRC